MWRNCFLSPLTRYFLYISPFLASLICISPNYVKDTCERIFTTAEIAGRLCVRQSRRCLRDRKLVNCSTQEAGLYFVHNGTSSWFIHLCEDNFSQPQK